MTDREQEARQAALTEYSHSKVRDRYDADLMMAGFQDGVVWADAHRSTEPPADVREALANELDDCLTSLTDTRAICYPLADAILSRFRVVPLGAEPYEDTWEYAAGYEGREDFAGRWFALGDWFAIREAAEREVILYVDDEQVRLIRRRKPGTAEPVNPRGEQP